LKGYLTDTDVALLAVDTPELLRPPVRAALERGPSFLSVISYWEVIIKSMKGTLDVGDPRQWWTETLEALALFPILYQPAHIAAIYDLPPIHRDPFDRALIAQATVEDLTLLTTDRAIPRYASERFRVIQ
jgi:PIN domain nuclease of toxin-antitoxin system